MSRTTRLAPAARPGNGLPAPAADSVLERLDTVVFQTDPAGNWTYLSPAWESLTGFSVAASLGTHFLDYVHPDERERTLALFMAVVSGGADLCHHRGRYCTADGQSRYVELRSRLLRNPAGEVVANVGTLTDLTSLVTAEEEVAEHAHLLELIDAGASPGTLPIGVAVYDAALRARQFSPGLQRMLGVMLEPGSSIERLYELFASTEREHAGGALGGPWGLVATARRTGRPAQADLRLERDGQSRLGMLRVSVLPTPLPAALQAGPPANPLAAHAGLAESPGVALVLQDISDLHRAGMEQAAVARLGQRALAGAGVTALLREAISLVTQTLGIAHAVVFERLPEARRPVAPRLRAREALGWPGGAAAIGTLAGERVPPFLQRALREDADVLRHHLPGPSEPAPQWLGEQGLTSTLSVRIGGGWGGPFGVLLAASSARSFSASERDFLQSVASVLGVAVERARAEERIRYQALHDPLTGLANRTLLHDRLHQALAEGRRNGSSVALLLMDLDRFKEINDTLGHHVGDDVLRVIGSRLRQVVRGSDSVARLGGDEFGVVLTGVHDVLDAIATAHKIRDRINQVISVQDMPLTVPATVGITIAPEHGTDPNVLLKHADVAMYRAKELGAALAVYSEDTDQHRPERLAYVGALRRAIEGDQLELHYQPRVDLADGRVTALEALVRWRHPSEGLIPPEAFVPLAERTGLIEPLTRRVLSLALEQARRWRATGRPRPVAVNVSARVLHDTDLVGVVAEELAGLDLPAAALQIELTESALMADPAHAVVVTRRLREAGIRLSIDDFGTGYSSLAYLRNFPVHQIKIDRSFLRDVVTSETDASIVGGIIDLAHVLGLTVVGEGIETAETCQLLRSLGCDEGQGFFLGRPTPPEQVG